MKKTNIRYMKPMIILSLALAFLGACQDETGNIGLQILPGVDTLSSKTIVTTDISAKSWLKDSIRIDDPSTLFLGSINDPVFGKTSMSIFSQLRITSPSDWQDEDLLETMADSLILTMKLEGVAGDTITSRQVRVYELNSPLEDREYYSDEDLSTLASGIKIGEETFIARSYVDTSGNSYLNDLEIRIDEALMNKFFDADESVYANKNNFAQFFNGLFIEAEDVDAQGNYASVSIGENTTPSNLTLYYRAVRDTSTEENVVKRDTLEKSYPFYITSFAKRIAYFQHDYTTSSFYSPDINEEGVTDTVLYIQPTGGTNATLTIPPISQIITDPGLEFDPDKELNAVLTKAEIVFTVDTVASDRENYPLPTRLLLSYKDENGDIQYPVDLGVSDTYYGGYLNSDYEYRFNITKHFEQLINGKTDVRDFILNTTSENSSLNRVILKGTSPDSKVSPIKFEVSYSEI